MALSDQLAKLSAQAKSLEESAADLHAGNKAKVEGRLTELRAALDQTQAEVHAATQAEADDVSAEWASLQKSVSDGFASLKKRTDVRRADHRASRADRAADNAELDAIDAIDFAVYALQEAEYYVLAAADARVAADEAEIQADLGHVE